VLSDINGTVGLDLGVYGAPETYVVDRHGVVQHRHVGVVDERVWQRDLASYFADVVVPSTSESTPGEGIL